MIQSSLGKPLSESIEQVADFYLKNYKPQKVNNNKIICDASTGFVQLYPHEVNILDSPIVQRLRHIFQASLAIFTYPSAGHSRLEHSIGCLFLADRFLKSLQNPSLSKTDVFTVRLAALLHDIGHGPFSHASEYFYGKFKDFNDSKLAERAFQLTDPAAHEILGFYLIKTKAFNKLWQEILSIYKKDNRSYYEEIKEIDLNEISGYLVCASSKEKRYLAQIINGPFDVDKIDYLHRDGYFSGIHTAIDTDRLLSTLHVSNDSETDCKTLMTDFRGITPLEQMVMNKMVIFSSLHYHHKVRSALSQLINLFEIIYNSKGAISIKGLKLDNPIDFLFIDDYDVLNTDHSSKDINEYIKKVKERNLYKRALVLSPLSLEKPKDDNFARLQTDYELQFKIRESISKEAGIELGNVFIDLPPATTYRGGTLKSKIWVDDKKSISFENIYPSSGWVTGYAEYRYKGYIFAHTDKNPIKEELKRIGKISLGVLRKEGIAIKEEDALAMANLN